MDGIHLSVSYEEGLSLYGKGIPFETCCTKFFSSDYYKHSTDINDAHKEDWDVKALWSDGSFVTVSRLRSNDGFHTDKYIRKAHHLERMLLAGCFKKDRK